MNNSKYKNMGINSNSGFSLIEVLITLAITGIIIIAVYSFINVGSNQYKSTKERTDLQQELTQINKLISEHIKESQEDIIRYYKANDGSYVIHTGVSNASVTYKMYVYNASTNSLYIYDEPTVVDEINATNSAAKITEDSVDNLISDNVTKFVVSFVSNSLDDDGNPVEAQKEVSTETVGAYTLTMYVPATDGTLVNIDSKIVVNKRTATSNETYSLRN